MLFTCPVHAQPDFLGIHVLEGDGRLTQVGYRYPVTVEIGIQVDVNPVRLADFVYELAHVHKG